VRSRLTDLGVAAIPFILGLIGPGRQHIDWNLPIGAAISAPLYWRRRYPLAALIACFAAGLVQLSVTLVDGALPRFYDLGLIIAIYSAVAYGAGRARLIAVGGGLAGATVAALLWVGNGMSGPNEAYALTVLFAPVLLAWAFGVTAQTRRDSLSRAAVAEERERIAREIHDIVAHSVSVMVVQSDGADAAFEQHDIDAARTAVAAIGRTGRDAMSELRLLLGMLRADRGGSAPQPGADQLPDLIASVPVDVRLRVEGQPCELPRGLGLAVFRIVQEALTNTVKHAGLNARADVALRYSGSALEIEVVDDGPGVTAPGRGGHGLVGMRERVAMFGGSFSAGPRPAGGFRVLARLPWT
jgi:signal transduction histidine kinase